MIKKKIVSGLFLLIFVMAVIKIIVLKELPLIRIGHLMLHFGGTQEGNANLIPFKTIIPYVLGAKGLLIGGINIIGNIVLFIPIGFVLPLVFEQLNRTKMVIIAIVTGLIIESMQAILHIGIFDIDDVILNGLGVYIGFLVLQLYRQWIKTQWKYIVVMVMGMPIIAFALYSMIYFKNHHSFPITLSNETPVLMDQNKSIHDSTNECCDLCGGTGGIGTVISIQANTFDIKRKDGKIIHVKLSGKGSIKSNVGTIHLVDVKVGNAVTLVGDALQDNSFIADVVLVCQTISNTSNLPSHKPIQ